MGEAGNDLFRALLRGSIEGGPAVWSAQELLGTLMDALPSAVCWKDTESRYLGCNRAFADLAGVEPDDIPGLSDADMPWSVDEQRCLELDRSVMDANRPVIGVRESMRTHDGCLIELSVNGFPLHDELGNVIGLVGTLRDVTAEAEAEADLQRSLEMLDKRVTERTSQLVRANQSLRKEVDERVRLQAEERRLREYAEIRRDLGAAMSRTLDLDEVLEILIGGAQDLVCSDLVAIILVNDETLELTRAECAFGYDIDDIAPAQASLPHHPGIQDVGRAIGLDQPNRPATLGPARSCIAVEMVTGGHLIGYLLLESRWSNFYVAEHGHRLRGVAEQAAAVISNIRMTQRATALAAAAERNRLRRDLHDSVVQTLACATLAIDTELLDMPPDDPARPGYERIQRLATMANTEIRHLLNEMQPSWTARSAIDLVQELVDRPDWPFTIELMTGDDGTTFDAGTASCLYRVAQEALHNATRHARTQHVRIELNEHGPVLLKVTDDGCGFDPSRVDGDHLGLSIMAERAKEIGARLIVDAAPGAGTSISVVINHADDGNVIDLAPSDEGDVVDCHENAFSGEGADTNDRSADIDGRRSVGG